MIRLVGWFPGGVFKDYSRFRENGIDDIGFLLLFLVWQNGREWVGWCFVEDTLEKVKNFQKWDFG